MSTNSAVRSKEYWENYAVVLDGQGVLPHSESAQVDPRFTSEVRLFSGPAGFQWWNTMLGLTAEVTSESKDGFTVVFNLLGPVDRSREYNRGIAESLRVAWKAACESKSKIKEGSGQIRESDGITTRISYARIIDGRQPDVLTDWVMTSMEAQLAEKFNVKGALSVSPTQWAQLTMQELAQLSAIIDAACPRRARVDLLDQEPSSVISIEQVNRMLAENTGKQMSNESKDQIVSLVHELQHDGAKLELNGLGCGITTEKRSNASTKRFKVRLLGGSRNNLATGSTLPAGLRLSK